MPEGPTPIRRGSLDQIEATVPAPGEMLLPTDPPNLGAVRIGTPDGRPGGVQLGLGPFERERLAALPHPPAGGDVVCLASMRHWQSSNTQLAGFSIPPDSTLARHHPVLAGHVPARTLSDGGFVELALHGWFRGTAKPGVETRLLVRLDINGHYAGPMWPSKFELGWGWWSAEARDHDAQRLKSAGAFDWMLRLRVHSLGGRGGVTLADGRARNLMLEGELVARTGELPPWLNEEQMQADPAFSPLVRKPIFQAVNGANPTPGEPLELVLSVAGAQRQPGGAGDAIQVHGGDMLLHAPRQGFAFGEHSLADPIF